VPSIKKFRLHVFFRILSTRKSLVDEIGESYGEFQCRDVKFHNHGVVQEVIGISV